MTNKKAYISFHVLTIISVFSVIIISSLNSILSTQKSLIFRETQKQRLYDYYTALERTYVLIEKKTNFEYDIEFKDDLNVKVKIHEVSKDNMKQELVLSVYEGNEIKLSKEITVMKGHRFNSVQR